MISYCGEGTAMARESVGRETSQSTPFYFGTLLPVKEQSCTFTLVAKMVNIKLNRKTLLVHTKQRFSLVNYN